MQFDFGNLRLEKLILHKVYERDQDGNRVAPFTSEQLTMLDERGLDTLQKRISAVLGSGTHCLHMAIMRTQQGSAFHLSTELLNADEDSFIDTSGHFAELLTDAQTSRRWPGGILVVIKATIGAASRPCIIILKAEIQAGFVEKDLDDVVIMEFIDSLVLTPQQKLYKVGMFAEMNAAGNDDEARNPSDFSAFVFDSNISAKDERAAARYFYESFLGLSIPQEAKHLTRNFFEATAHFINESDVSVERKVDLHNALNTYLKTDQSDTINPTVFAEQYFEVEQRDDYLFYVEEVGIPNHSIPKDITLIRKELRSRKMKFSTNVKITAPSDQFEELIEVIESDETSTTLKVQGQLLEQS